MAKNLHDCLSPFQVRGLSELLGFEGQTPPEFLSRLRALPPQPGIPLMRDVVAAYLEAVATRAGL